LIPETELAANTQAALLLVARPLLRSLGLAQVSAKAVLEATGAAKTRAYELSRDLRDRLDQLAAPVGRPTKSTDEPTTDHDDVRRRLARQVLEYLYAHPGAAERRTTKAHYTAEFRDFVVGLCTKHATLDVETIADELMLPVTTVRGWLRATAAGIEQTRDSVSVDRSTPTSANGGDTTASTNDGQTPTPMDETGPLALSLAGSSASGLHVQTVLVQWSGWCGDNFTSFCEHLQQHHGVPFGRTTLTSILEMAGERLPNKRRGRSPDERALRESFASFFPGAVWVGDGCELTIEYGGWLHRFNLELIVDTDSSAAVGLDVRDHEDAEAVIAAFEDCVDTTGAPPLALLLDNKPSNHAPAVIEATEGTLVIPATINRPQNKGHVEGSFGLFSQVAPPLRVLGRTLRERARSTLELCARIFFAALNMRPRASRGGQSRIDLYRSGTPTPEQIEQAKSALKARLDKQLAARQTLRERQDPAKRAYLDDALSRLGLTDPTGHVQAAIARYDLDDIADGVAIFSGRQRAKKLPDGVDIRYLLGIVKNLAAEREGMAIAMALWDERLAARDFAFAGLIAERSAIDTTDPEARLLDCVDRALASERKLPRYFWLHTVAQLVLEHPPAGRRALYERVARRIHTNYRVPHKRRLDATRVIADKVLPLA